MIYHCVIVEHMKERSMILEAAARLLAESSTGDVSTRAISEAAGVQQPTLFRMFGDKAGLLAAIVDYGFEQYLDSKRTMVPSTDPVLDLRDGWDNHVAFALGHPHIYRLMFASNPSIVPSAIRDGYELLEEVLDRCARQGALRLPPRAATQLIMAANTGVALALVMRPDLNAVPELSSRLREIVLAGVLAKGTEAGTGSLAQSAVTVGALVRQKQPDAMTSAEAGLLTEWMDRLTEVA